MSRHSIPGLLLLWQVVSQTPAPGSIQGVVTHWQSTDAVAEAIVELRTAANPGGTAVAITATRANGEFVFPRVAPGAYRIYATRAGYATGEYGRKRPAGVGSPVSVLAGEQRKDLRIEVTVGASVSGRITYSDGTPMPLSLVQSFKLGFSNGRAELNPQQSAYTNDLGEYRLFDLAPGAYYISAVNAQNTVTGRIVVNPSSNARNDATGTTLVQRTLAPITRSLGTDAGQTLVAMYFPGTPDWEKATPIDVRSGSDIRNINIVMIPAVTRTIKGVALDADSRQPPAGTIVASLTQLDTKLPLTSRALQFNPDNGRFQFTVNQSGTFEVRVTAGQLAGLGVVNVNQADAEVSVPLYPPANLSGSIRIEQSAGAAAPADLSGARVTLRNRSPGYTAVTAFVSAEQMQAQLAAATRTPGTVATTAGSFQLQNIPVGAYLIEATLPNLPDAYVKSIQLRGENILNQEVRVEGTPPGNMEILIGLQGGLVEGRVVGDGQRPVSNATVVLVPAGLAPFNAAQYRNATTPPSGEFQFRGLPPGEYQLYAWEDIDPGAWFNPGFMRAYETTGKPIRIDDGAKLRIDVVANPVN